ncbi:hypothetical protein DFJ73DRAFT_208834 [Zopfochytrium polystomum]|nr:hypothetical protein DFJ73DRAFT_208834 [Zopfochytrium polystomum]
MQRVTPLGVDPSEVRGVALQGATPTEIGDAARRHPNRSGYRQEGGLNPLSGYPPCLSGIERGATGSAVAPSMSRRGGAPRRRHQTRNRAAAPLGAAVSEEERRREAPPILKRGERRRKAPPNREPLPKRKARRRKAPPQLKREGQRRKAPPGST